VEYPPQIRLGVKPVREPRLTGEDANVPILAVVVAGFIVLEASRAVLRGEGQTSAYSAPGYDWAGCGLLLRALMCRESRGLAEERSFDVRKGIAQSHVVAFPALARCQRPNCSSRQTALCGGDQRLNDVVNR
jgi:hypothetical protein